MVEKNPNVVFYCGSSLDFILFAPVQAHLPKIPIVTDDQKTKQYLQSKGIHFIGMPSFPEIVIMTCQAANKFPSPKIKIIGMSAIEKWVDYLTRFSESYNVLVTLHPWVSKKYRNQIANTSRVSLIEDPDILPFLMISDLMIGDTNFLLTEFCALNKPIITFKVKSGKRNSPEIQDLIRNISIQIESIDDLPAMIESVISRDQKSDSQGIANKMIFDQLDGKAGYRAAKHILEMIELKEN